MLVLPWLPEFKNINTLPLSTSDDNNLCSKALLSGVKALSKNDLEAEVVRSGHGLNFLQNLQTSVLPDTNPQISSPVLNRSHTPLQRHSQDGTRLSQRLTEKGEPKMNAFLMKNRKLLTY